MNQTINYCLIVILFILIIVSCCLGSKLIEGATSSDTSGNTTDSSGNSTDSSGNTNNTTTTSTDLGNYYYVDTYGCYPNQGEQWCDALNRCTLNYDICCNNIELLCGDGTSWDSYKKQCVQTGTSNSCGEGTYFDTESQTCLPNSDTTSSSCGDGTTYDASTNSCIPTSNYCGDGTYFDASSQLCLPNQSDSSGDIYCGQGTIFDVSLQLCVQSTLDQNYSYNEYPGGDYILKSSVVPPVCPVCPPIQACPSNKKCPPCPAPEPIQPCPPCARCPEPAFECAKVPNYNSTNTEYLPRPLLNDFSKFT